MSSYILVDPEHHLFEKLIPLEVPTLKKEELKDKDLKGSTLYDFTIGNQQKKNELFDLLLSKEVQTLYSDLSCCPFFDHKLSPFYFSSAFFSPKAAIEIKKAEGFQTELFETLGLSLVENQESQDFFVFPRTLATIINEAYFALEDKIAEKQDIDTAMRFGVNYPLGPFDWAKKTKSKAITTLLDELSRYYEDERYQCAPLLRKEL